MTGSRTLPTPEAFLKVIDARLGAKAGSIHSSGLVGSGHRRVGRPTTEDATDTRSLILSAALRCFGTDGYGRTTNSQIAQMAGVSPPTIYHYFDSKASLFQTVSNMAHREVFERVSTAAAMAHDTRHRIAALIHTLSVLFREVPHLAGFIANYAVEVRRNPEVLRLSPRELLSGPINYFAELIRVGQDTGEVDPSVDALAAAGMALSLIYGMATFFTVSLDEDLNFQMMDTTEKMILGQLFN